jgi:6,7-dimethyl-8-ribityllumazine synthase
LKSHFEVIQSKVQNKIQDLMTKSKGEVCLSILEQLTNRQLRKGEENGNG